MSVPHNIAANLAGRSVAVLASIVAVPVYFNALGVEAYGLVGLFICIQTLYSLLEAGLSTSVGREFAKLSTDSSFDSEKAGLILRTYELVFFAAMTLLALFSLVALPSIGAVWVGDASGMDAQDIRAAFVLMGIGAVCKLPISLYMGAVNGVQRQVVTNLLSGVFTVIRTVGAILIVLLSASKLVAFFAWHAVVYLLEFIAFAIITWRIINVNGLSVRFSIRELSRTWRFAFGAAVISVTAALVSQTDKLVLSWMLPLEDFGYYMVAVNVAGILYNIAYPVGNAFAPRFTQQGHHKNAVDLANSYHLACQLVAALCVPAALILVAESDALLALYLGIQGYSSMAADLTKIVSVGVIFGCLMVIPHTLQVSQGRTRAIAVWNAISFLVYAPALWFLTLKYGLVGGAWAFVAQYLVYLLTNVWWMHKSLLKGEYLTWLIHDVAIPIASGASAIIAARELFFEESLLSPVRLALLAIFSTAGVMFSCRQIRQAIRVKIDLTR